MEILSIVSDLKHLLENIQDVDPAEAKKELLLVKNKLCSLKYTNVTSRESNLVTLDQEITLGNLIQSLMLVKEILQE